MRNTIARKTRGKMADVKKKKENIEEDEKARSEDTKQEEVIGLERELPKKQRRKGKAGERSQNELMKRG